MAQVYVFKNNIPYDIIINPVTDNIFSTVIYFPNFEEDRNDFINRYIEKEPLKNWQDNLSEAHSYIRINGLKATVKVDMSKDNTNRTYLDFLNANFLVIKENGKYQFFFTSNPTRINSTVIQYDLTYEMYFSDGIQNIFDKDISLLIDRATLKKFEVVNGNANMVLRYDSVLGMNEEFNFTDDVFQLISDDLLTFPNYDNDVDPLGILKRPVLVFWIFSNGIQDGDTKNPQYWNVDGLNDVTGWENSFGAIPIIASPLINVSKNQFWTPPRVKFNDGTNTGDMINLARGGGR